MPSTATGTTLSCRIIPKCITYCLAGPNLIYAIGGDNSGGILATVEAYAPLTNTWASKASMPTARRLLGVVSAHNLIYAIGGTNNSGNLATVEAYTPGVSEWLYVHTRN
jgi:hypothetical protein